MLEATISPPLQEVSNTSSLSVAVTHYSSPFGTSYRQNFSIAMIVIWWWKIWAWAKKMWCMIEIFVSHLTKRTVTILDVLHWFTKSEPELMMNIELKSNFRFNFLLNTHKFNLLYSKPPILKINLLYSKQFIQTYIF